MLYTQMLIEPVDLILMWYDELQVGQASLARLLGVHDVPDPVTDGSASRRRPTCIATDVRFGYREGRDVLHGVNLDVEPGERVAIVGPSGAGKSTLGRLLAGLHAPRTGTVEMGGVALARLPTEKVRRHVALVTQEHHVFVGTLRDNLRLAQPRCHRHRAVGGARRRRCHRVGLEALPDGLETEVGVGRHKLTPAQAQQLALARLVLADPHTLVLDEATSLLDPRAARHLEQSLAAVLEGRTVIAIAHRLMTAHDAEARQSWSRTARIAEAGSHDELVSANVAPTPHSGVAGATKTDASSRATAARSFDALELLEVGVPGRCHRSTQRTEQVHRPVRRTGRPHQHLFHRTDDANPDALTARQLVMVRLGSPVQSRPGASVARANGDPIITASAPQAIALAMSPLLPTPPSAMTWTYRPPDSSM